MNTDRWSIVRRCTPRPDPLDQHQAAVARAVEARLAAGRGVFEKRELEREEEKPCESK